MIRYNAYVHGSFEKMRIYYNVIILQSLLVSRPHCTIEIETLSCSGHEVEEAEG